MFRASVCLRLCMWVRVYVFNSKNAFGENWPPPIVIRCMAWDRVHDCIKVAKYINELITIIYRYYCDFSILSPSIALAIVRTFWWRPVPWITEPADPATVSILTHIAQKKYLQHKEKFELQFFEFLVHFLSLYSFGGFYLVNLVLWSHQPINFSMEIDYENSRAQICFSPCNHPSNTHRLRSCF